MSDQSKHECAHPGKCVVHLLSAARVRAVEVEGEKYVNLADFINYMTLDFQADVADVVREEVGPDASSEVVQEAVESYGAVTAGAARVVSNMHAVLHYEILPLSDPDGVLVSPEAMRNVPDGVPNEWLPSTP